MISVVINTLNEAQNIADCIASAQGLADEILVCDMKSDDATQDIARSLGARVVEHERTGFVEPARRYAIEQARMDWVFVLDADERMTPTLAKRLRELAQRPDLDVVRVWSLYWYFGGWVRHGGFFNDQWPRFFRRQVYLDSFRPEEQRVHGNFGALMNHDNLLILDSEHYILHFAYPTVEHYVDKTVRKYAHIEAQQHVADGGAFKLHRMLYDPLRSFIGRYFLKGGCRDGVRGLVLAALFAAYRFCFWAMVWYERDRERQDGRLRVELAKLSKENGR